MSSSGFVPMPFSKRVLKEYGVSLSTPLSLEMVPLPSFKPPRQTADALRFMFALCWSEREFAPTRPRLVWCLRNNYTFAAMDSYFGDTTLATVSSHLKRDNGAPEQRQALGIAAVQPPLFCRSSWSLNVLISKARRSNCTVSV